MGLPSRFKESNFRRFEPVLFELVKIYPQPLILRPNGLTCETFSCRLRDAVKTLKDNEWPTTIDKAVLFSVWNNVEVSHDGTRVRIGPPVTKEMKALEYEAVQKAQREGAEIVVEKGTLEELTAFALLLNNGRLHCTVRFKDKIIDSAIYEVISGFINVAAQPDGPDLLLL